MNHLYQYIINTEFHSRYSYPVAVETNMPYLRLELSIELFMSFRESVNDLNSNELRSPPSAKHCSNKQTTNGNLSNTHVQTFICMQTAHNQNGS